MPGTLKILIKFLAVWFEDSYCSITVANHRLITIIRFVAKNYIHFRKNFINRFHLVLHAEARRATLRSLNGNQMEPLSWARPLAVREIAWIRVGPRIEFAFFLIFPTNLTILRWLPRISRQAVYHCDDDLRTPQQACMMLNGSGMKTVGNDNYSVISFLVVFLWLRIKRI